MKGLLLKDFYTIWKGGRIFLILYVFMAAVSGVNIQNGWSYMGFWLVMMDSQTSSTFSYDHSCNWNRFALTMPVTRKRRGAVEIPVAAADRMRQYTGVSRAGSPCQSGAADV